jgi:hypothetical protein
VTRTRLDEQDALRYGKRRVIQTRSSRFQSLFPALAAAVVVLYALELGSSLGHFALVQHVRCAAHGELMDVVPSSHASRVEPHSPRGKGVWGGSDEHDHDHCVFSWLASRHASARAAARSVVEAPVQHVFRTQVAPAEAPAPPISVLALAPKASPPMNA